MSVTWSGLEEFKRQLRQLPEELKADATQIIDREVSRAEAEMHAGYAFHRKTGELDRGLKRRDISAGPFGYAAQLVNRSPLAWIFENGTQLRKTTKGYSRGKMPVGGGPPGKVFVPIAARRRRAMYAALKAMLVSKGLIVRGDAP